MTPDQKFLFLSCPLSLSISTPGLCQQLQGGLRGKKEGGEKENRQTQRVSSGRNKDRYGYRLPPNVFLLSHFGYRNHKEPQATLLALYSVFGNFLAADGERGSGASTFKESFLVRSRGCADMHTCTQNQVPKLPGMRSGLLPLFWVRRGRRRLSERLSLLGGVCEDRDNAEVKKELTAEKWGEKSGPDVQVRTDS